MNSNLKAIKTITVALIIFIVLLLIALMINLIRKAKYDSVMEELQTKIAQQQSLIEENQSTIDYKETDEYIERYARNYLSMKRHGEKVATGKTA